jgi:hypothetical protein
MVARFGYLKSEYTYCMPVPAGSCQQSSEGYTVAYCISYPEYYNHVSSNLLGNPLLYIS